MHCWPAPQAANCPHMKLPAGLQRPIRHTCGCVCVFVCACACACARVGQQSAPQAANIMM
jgi:hypothetical protein